MHARDGGRRLTFFDGGVELQLDPATCRGLTQEFFYDPHPQSTEIALPNESSSGCDLEVAGIEKPAFVRFYYALKRAVARKDRAAVAAMVRYPVDVRLTGRELRIAGPSQLIRHYEEIFDNDCIRQTILSQRVADLFCRDLGVMFGDGEIWISEDEETHQPKIARISMDPACRLTATRTRTRPQTPAPPSQTPAPPSQPP